MNSRNSSASQSNRRVLGSHQNHGVNLSQLINKHAAVRVPSQGGTSSRLDSKALMRLEKASQAMGAMRSQAGDYTAIHDFAQDQLTQITNQEELLRSRILSQTMSQHSSRKSAHINAATYLQRYTSAGADDHTSRGSAHTNMQKGRSVKHPDDRRKELLMQLYGDQKTKCSAVDCSKPIYKDHMCKHHFAQRVKKAFRMQFKNMYRGPEYAYNTLDHKGLGYITEEDILNSPIMARLGYSKEDASHCFKMFNIFNNVSRISALKDGVPHNGMPLDKFRQNFFPQLHILEEENQSDEEREFMQEKSEIKKKGEGQSEAVALRVQALDKKIKNRIANNYFQVRKAFLALDEDFDGFITAEDFLRYFSTDKTINFADLKKLILDRDTSKSGKLSFADFSQWLGGSIHQLAGFYFRHDSKKNPIFDASRQNHDQRHPEKFDFQCRQAYNRGNLLTKVMDKIYEQWKTMRKAFIDMNVSKSGFIQKSEFKFYLTHWGMKIPEEQFEDLFKALDSDGDGQISYKDFQKTVGKNMQPDQGEFWRQDMAYPIRIKSCKEDNCWHMAQEYTEFCKIHSKVKQQQAYVVIIEIQKKLKKAWGPFIRALKKTAEEDDQDQVFLDDLSSLCKHFKLNVTKKQIELLQDAFPGRKEGTALRINVSRFYDLEISLLQRKIYQHLEFDKNGGDDKVFDASGYTGQMFRPKQQAKLVPIDEREFYELFLKDNRLKQMDNMLREIDHFPGSSGRTGFCTRQELDDILKIIFKEELEQRDLEEIIAPFSPIQNKILVNYRQFRQHIFEKMKAHSAKQNSSNNATPTRNPSQDKRAAGLASPINPGFNLSKMAKSSAALNSNQKQAPLDKKPDSSSKNAQKRMLQSASRARHNQSAPRDHSPLFVNSDDGKNNMTVTLDKTKKADGIVNLRDLLSRNNKANSNSTQQQQRAFSRRAQSNMGQTPKNNLMQLIEDHVKNVEKEELEEARSRSGARSVQNLFANNRRSSAGRVVGGSRNDQNAKSRTIVPKQTDLFENDNTPRNAQILEAYQNSHIDQRVPTPTRTPHKQQQQQDIDVASTISALNAATNHNNQGAGGVMNRGKSVGALYAANSTAKKVGGETITTLLEKNLRANRNSLGSANPHTVRNKSGINRPRHSMSGVGTAHGAAQPIQTTDLDPFNAYETVGDMRQPQQIRAKTRAQSTVRGAMRTQDARDIFGQNLNQFGQSRRQTLDKHQSNFNTIGGQTRPTSQGNNSTSQYSMRRVQSQLKTDKEQLKGKVGYEWKRIFRGLSRADDSGSGQVHASDFQKVCDDLNVKVADSDVRRAQKLYAGFKPNTINFMEMSRDMNLHMDSLDQFYRMTQKLKSPEAIAAMLAEDSAKRGRMFSAAANSPTFNDYANHHTTTATSQQQPRGIRSQFDKVAQFLANKRSIHAPPQQQPATSPLHSGSQSTRKIQERAHHFNSTFKRDIMSAGAPGSNERQNGNSKPIVLPARKQSIFDNNNAGQTRQQISKILMHRGAEFKEVLSGFLGPKGLTEGSLMPVSTFKSCLSAFGLKIRQEDWAQFVKKRVVDSGPKKSVNNVLFSEVNPKEHREEMLNVVNDLESTTTVKIVSGYRRRIPASKAGDVNSARAVSENNDYRASSQTKQQEKKQFERTAFNTTKMMGVDVSAFLRAYGV